MAFNIMVKCTAISIHSEIKQVTFEPTDVDDSNIWGEIFSVDFNPEDADYNSYEVDGEYKIHVSSTPKEH